MKLIFTLAMAFIFQSSLFSQKGKTVTEYYYKDLKKAEGKLDKAGKKTGEWTFWEISGKICEKRHYKLDLLDGETVIEKLFFDPSNSKIESIKSDSAKYQTALKRQLNAKLDTIHLKGNYTNNLKKGVFLYYDNKKNIIKEETYNAGKLNGSVKKFDDTDGKILSIDYYTIGKLDSSDKFQVEYFDMIRYINFKNERTVKYYIAKILKKKTSEWTESNLYTLITCYYENTHICDTIYRDLTRVDINGDSLKFDDRIVTNSYDDFDGRDLIIVEIPNNKEEVVVDEIFDVVEEQPQFPGGNAELYKFISSNYTMDSTMKAQAIAGKIYVSFVIDKDGSVTQAKVLKGLSEPLDKEAMRVVNLMPKWIPGKQRGKEVKVRYNLPIVIKYDK